MLEQITNAIKLTTDIYLSKHLPRIPEDKKQIAIEAYENDIKRLSNYIFESCFFDEDFALTEEFIKLLHKKFYPENFIQKGKDEKGNEIIWMIPGEYKIIDNLADTSDKAKFFGDLPGWTEEKGKYTKAMLVGEKMFELIKNFNEEYYNSDDSDKKKDLIFLFILDLINIHPFSDGNGRVAGILLDLYLLKLGFKPIGLKTIVGKDKLVGDRTIFLVCNERKPGYIYDFIDKHK